MVRDMQIRKMAGEPGLEPGLAESESAGLPLTYSPAGVLVRFTARYIFVRDEPHQSLQSKQRLAGEPGFEPGLTESESVGLPLTYSPTEP